MPFLFLCHCDKFPLSDNKEQLFCSYRSIKKAVNGSASSFAGTTVLFPQVHGILHYPSTGVLVVGCGGWQEGAGNNQHLLSI